MPIKTEDPPQVLGSACQRGLYSAKAAVDTRHQLVHLLGRDHQGWCDEGVVAELTVGAALARVHGHSRVDARSRKAERDAILDGEWLARRLVLHELYTQQQPQAAYVAED